MRSVSRVASGNNARGSPRVRLITSLAMLAVMLGGVWFYSVRKTNELFDIGVNDHIHCAVEGNYPPQTGRAEMAAALGDRFAPMLQPLVDAAGTVTVISAHHCTAGGRDDVHIVLKSGRTPISVVLAPRGNEGVFPRALSGRIAGVNGIEIHESSRDGYAVAAFQSGAWLGYIVSALPERRNDELARRIAPVIGQYTKA